MDEQELLQGCVQGVRDAQEELFAQTSRRIYRLLFRMTGSREQAFDLTQETYLKAFTRIGQFDGKSAITTWLYRIATNEALQYLRRQRRAPKTISEADRHTDSRPVDHRDLCLDLDHALRQLAPSDRAILLLRYNDGLDYRAIAGVLGCAEGTVASRLNRARERLRGILAGGYGDTEENAPGEHQTDWKTRHDAAEVVNFGGTRRN